jgi:hypothetical protein
VNRIPRAILIAVLLVLCPAAQAQQRIGVSGAVNPDVVGTPPGAPMRRLVVGQEIVHNEHIATSAGGLTQILFIDGSAITIGPNSDLTIDEFVYDPDNGSGHLAMSAARGVLRFVGGSLSKGENSVSLRTPSATIGIRGGIFLAKLGPNGQLDVTFIYGKGLTVTGICGVSMPSSACGLSQTVNRPGFAVHIGGLGAAPSKPAPAPSNSINSILAQLNGKPGDTGGAATAPTDTTVVNSTIASTVSANVPASVQAANQNTAMTTAATTPVATTAYATSQSDLEINTVGSQGQAQIAAIDASPPAQGATIPGVVISVAGLTKSTNGPATVAGFIDQSSNGVIPFAQGTITYPAGPVQQNGTFVVSGSSGTLATLSPLTPGATTSVTGQTRLSGTITGTATMTPDGNFFYADLLSTDPSANGQRQFIFAGVPVSQSFYAPTATQRFYAFNVQPDSALAAGSQPQTIPFLPSNFGGTMANASVSPLYLVTPANTAFGATSATSLNTPAPRWLQASLAINGQGSDQSSALTIGLGSFFTASDGTIASSGPVRGAVLNSATGPLANIRASSATVSDGLGNTLFGGSTISGFVLDQNQYDSTFSPASATATATMLNGGTTTAASYAFNQPVTAIPLPANVGVTRSALNETGWFGGIMKCCAANSNFVLTGPVTLQSDPTSSRLAAQFVGSDPFTTQPSGFSQLVLNFGSLPPVVGLSHSTFIDNNLFAAAENPVVPAAIFTQGSGTPSDATLALVSSAVVPSATLLPPGVSFCDCQYLQWGYWTGQVAPAGSGSSAFNAAAMINTWVAGQPTVTMPTTGTGTFTGAAIGSVSNNGANYLAAGGFTNTYNFATNTGNVTISNFDNNTFTGTVRSTSGASYAGGLIGANVKGIASGTFYGPSAQETGGTFSVQGVNSPSYIASGIFAGKR